MKRYERLLCIGSVVVATTALCIAIVIFALALTCTPFIINSTLGGSQHASNTPLEVREEIATLTLRYVIWGIDAQHMIETYRSDGEIGLDEIAHLRDVRAVFVATWTAGIVAACVAFVMFAWQWRKGWHRAQRRALLITGGICVGGPLVLGVIIVAAFTAVFDLFHRVLFEAGTWTFPTSTLLIQTFPEPFWRYIALVWAGLIVICGWALFGLVGPVGFEPTTKRL